MQEVAAHRDQVAHWLAVAQVFGGGIDDPAHLMAVFEAHNAAVRDTISPERLLVLDVAEGWAPLCAFLGVPTPDKAFPRTNGAAEFRSGIGVKRAGP